MQRFRKPLVIFLSASFALTILSIVICSFLVKCVIERDGPTFIGRRVAMDWAYANPFTGYVHLAKVKVLEVNAAGENFTDSLFLSVDGLSINFSMLKLLFQTYEAGELMIEHPVGVLVQNADALNCSDIIETFWGQKNGNAAHTPLRVIILDAKIINGEFQYRDEVIPINYKITKVDIETSGVRWDADTISATFNFSQGVGGGIVKGDFTINTKTSNYRLALQVRKFNLDIIQQYLKELTNFGHFAADFEADLRATGNLKDQRDLTAKGSWALSDLRFGKNAKEDYLSFDKLSISINELSPKNHKYFYDSVVLLRPFVKFELYDSLDNFQMMFGKSGSNIQAANNSRNRRFNLVIKLARYLKVLSSNFFRSDYKINRLAIVNGNVTFNDFSLSEKFSVALAPLNISADSINKNKRANINLRSGVRPYGDLVVNLSLIPADTGDFDMNFKLEGISAAMFNPYTITYTSFPLDRGTIELRGAWKVRNGVIKGDNHLTVIDPRQGTPLKNRDTHWVPLPLVMALLRERGNVIDYTVPITGNLRSPRFHVSDVVFDLLGNIFIKPATTSYGAQVNRVENLIERSVALKWAMRDSSIPPEQKKFIRNIADHLAKNPTETITVYPCHFTRKEKEYILDFETRKKFFLQTRVDQSFNADDLEEVDNLAMRGGQFSDYLNRAVPQPLLFTIQDKCALLIDSMLVNVRFSELNAERRNSFLSYFKERNVQDQVVFAAEADVIPFDGFSFYKIEYSDAVPDFIKKAYVQINYLNNRLLRRKFRIEKVRKNLLSGE
jgi:hypothetical protein